jgi:hypothetical protein
MKYLITENKLEKLIFSYLDNKNFIVKETINGYYIFENEGDKYAQIMIRTSDMTCFIHFRLTKEIESFFSINFYQSEKVLKRFITKILNIEVHNVRNAPDDAIILSIPRQYLNIS